MQTLKNSNALFQNNNDDSINAIRTGHLDESPVLVSVGSKGDVNVWFLENLEINPLTFNTKSSTWGVAINNKRMLVAVSSNNKLITIFNLQTFEKSLLTGHSHNIPNLEFDHNRFLISCSIDETCRVWDIITMSCCLKINVDCMWVWSVRFLNQKDFLTIYINNKKEINHTSTRNQQSGIDEDLLGHLKAPDQEALLEFDPPSSLNREELETRRYLDEAEYNNNYPNTLTRYNKPSSPEIQENDLESQLQSKMIFTTTIKDAFLIETFFKIRNHQSINKQKKSLAHDTIRKIFENNKNRYHYPINQFDRINMTETIPDMSLIISLTQRGHVAIIRYVKYLQKEKDPIFRIYTEKIIPQENMDIPILGFFVDKCTSKYYTINKCKLFIIYINGKIMVYEIVK